MPNQSWICDQIPFWIPKNSCSLPCLTPLGIKNFIANPETEAIKKEIRARKSIM
jgi:hypothetical protein